MPLKNIQWYYNGVISLWTYLFIYPFTITHGDNMLLLVPRVTSSCDFQRVVAFGHNELWRPLTANSFSKTSWIENIFQQISSSSKYWMRSVILYWLIYEITIDMKIIIFLTWVCIYGRGRAWACMGGLNNKKIQVHRIAPWF